MFQTGIYEADLRLYKSSDVSDMFTNEGLGDWDVLQSKVDMSGDNVHELLLKLKSQDYRTNQDGTYEIYVLPGTYDLLIDAPAYLDCVYINRTLQEGDTLDLGFHALLASDLDKSGLINGKDLAMLGSVMGTNAVDTLYNIDYDFDKDGSITGKELAYLGSNFFKTREVIK